MFNGGRIQAKLLGPVTAWDSGKPVDLGPPRQRAVFAILSAHVNEVVSREQLIDDVWGADAPATAVNSVYTYVAGLRSRLEPSRPHRGSPRLLISTGSGYRLELDHEVVDVHRFNRHLTQARTFAVEGEPRRAVGELDAALALWRGAPYGGVVGPFAEGERIRLAEQRLGAIEDRAELLLNLQPQNDLVGELVGMVRRHPLRERLRYVLMRCYASLGRQADALGEYHDLRARLAEELGIEPGEALHQFYVQLLRRSQSRRVDPAPVETPPEETPAGRSVPLAQLTRDVPGFTGRRALLRRLDELVTAAEQRREAALIVLTGGPGSGKTAAAVHFARTLAARFPDGQLQLDLRGFGDRSNPMDPAEALGNLLSMLSDWAPSPANHEQQCALYRGLVNGRRMLLLLDNVESAEQVRPLLPGTSSCVVIVTSRNRLTGLSIRDGAQRVTVDAMDDDEAVDLFLRTLGRPVRPERMAAVRRLVTACGRLPLALRVAAGRISAAPDIDRAVEEFPDCHLLGKLDVPGDEESSVRKVFEWSYQALPPRAAAMFRAIGRHGGPDISLADAACRADMDEVTARRALATLLEAGMLEQPAADRFRCNTLLFAYARELAGAPQHPLQARAR